MPAGNRSRSLASVAGAGVLHTDSSAGPPTQVRRRVGPRLATSLPATVMVNSSPPSARRSTSPMLFRSSFCGIVAIATDGSRTTTAPGRPRACRHRRRAELLRWAGRLTVRTRRRRTTFSVRDDPLARARCRRWESGADIERRHPSASIDLRQTGLPAPVFRCANLPPGSTTRSHPATGPSSGGSQGCAWSRQPTDPPIAEAAPHPARFRRHPCRRATPSRSAPPSRRSRDQHRLRRPHRCSDAEHAAPTAIPAIPRPTSMPEAPKNGSEPLALCRSHPRSSLTAGCRLDLFDDCVP
jgi:hypothetical protein